MGQSRHVFGRDGELTLVALGLKLYLDLLDDVRESALQAIVAECGSHQGFNREGKVDGLVAVQMEAPGVEGELLKGGGDRLGGPSGGETVEPDVALLESGEQAR